jgi:hypothetical protein
MKKELTNNYMNLGFLCYCNFLQSFLPLTEKTLPVSANTKLYFFVIPMFFVVNLFGYCCNFG